MNSICPYQNLFPPRPTLLLLLIWVDSVIIQVAPAGDMSHPLSSLLPPKNNWSLYSVSSVVEILLKSCPLSPFLYLCLSSQSLLYPALVQSLLARFPTSSSSESLPFKGVKK